MTRTQRRARQAQETLRKAVSHALQEKERLGQYAIVFQDGKTVQLEADQLSQLKQG